MKRQSAPEKTDGLTDRRRAVLMTGLLHSAFFISLLLLKVEQQSLPDEEIVVTWRSADKKEQPTSVRSRQTSGGTNRSRVPSEKSVRKVATPLLREPLRATVREDATPPATREEFVKLPRSLEATTDTSRSRSAFETDLMAPALTEQQAFAELGRLLKEHPEYKHLILRELFAGDGRVPMKKWMLDPRLDDILRFNTFLSSYEYELMKSGGGGYMGPYDPVHGFDRDKRKGFLVNVSEVLQFLQKLLGLK